MRWALLLFLVFDQMGAPLHGHRHDSGIDGSALAQMRQADDVLVATGSACMAKFRPAGVHPSTPYQICAQLSFVAAPRKASAASWLELRQVLIATWLHWPDWPVATAVFDHLASVELPPPRTRAASAPPHTRAPPQRA